jgi:hypothetical protein
MLFTETNIKLYAFRSVESTPKEVVIHTPKKHKSRRQSTLNDYNVMGTNGSKSPAYAKFRNFITKI